MKDWIEHSVNCYYCGILFDEREGQNADLFNNNDGGSICPSCLKTKTPPYSEDECPNCRSGTIGIRQVHPSGLPQTLQWRLVCQGKCGHDFGPAPTPLPINTVITPNVVAQGISASMIEVITPTRVLAANAQAVLNLSTKQWEASIYLPNDTYSNSELDALPLLIEKAVAEARRLLASRPRGQP